MAINYFRIAAGLAAFVSLGFGIPGVTGALHYARTGEMWRLFGFPTYGPGLLEKWGVPTSAGLMMAFSCWPAVTKRSARAPLPSSTLRFSRGCSAVAVGGEYEGRLAEIGVGGTQGAQATPRHSASR
jgi:hypothetical protein